MFFFQAILIIFIWVAPFFFFQNAYKKMSKKEQQDVKIELKNPFFFLTFGGCCIGFQVFITGSISEIKIIQHIGSGLVFIGLVTACVSTFRQRQFKKSFALMMIGILGAIFYFF
ncbi:hypothetical protein [Cytobacillus sp. FSL R5-0377]|uniref:hypothetical protein n=2 Tax=unclassified Cytobacillus TaxID=2675268 RepID=UPI00135C972D|nr:hypothetical protein KIS4809_0377 [Bacillus sp. ZZV12-4809]MCM3093376.1 hypothetical protein [Cytobacillus sp. AMY 15.2]